MRWRSGSAPPTGHRPRSRPGVNKVSWLLIRFMFVMAPLVLFINGFTKGDWIEALLFALSIAVGLTPEMLPMIVTSTLAKGAVLLSRKQGHRQAAGRDPELRRDGRAVHRQDRHPDPGQDLPGAHTSTSGATTPTTCWKWPTSTATTRPA